ncbi:DsbA family oxidoreductase [Ferrimonas balearica]|uniref:DsbA family oxidoreductase n=1 Tax=Ferrimonas balearica TaxID=44012 RepID=UPI001C99B695|nr:DsbA family oxidoreductase [Ferrimonas balearica]MBY5991005.1 DsbA family oxidoreductase [Ferrimonas balearica]
MPALTIDIVSDVVCPWCIIGYQSLRQALDNQGLDAEIRWHPFELNPQMPAEGQDLGAHLREKYGITPEQSAQNRQMIEQRAQALGFPLRFTDNARIYNTFDAHRLLSWAAEQDKQTELKLALFRLYFVEGGNPSDRSALVACAQSVGLKAEIAREVLEQGRYAEAVRSEQGQWPGMGISAVPAFIINRQYLISGGQSVEAFEQALGEIHAG